MRVSWTGKRSNEWVLQIFGLHNTSLMEPVKEKKLKYFGHTIRKSVSLEKDIIEGMMTGSRALRGRPKINWMNSVTSRTELTTDGAIRAADDREVWRKIVYDETSHRIQDG